MNNVTFEPLRWQEDPVRITVYHEAEYLRAYYQVTAPRDLEGICKGRPVEELPRILTLLSPTHHLASAMALDRLFGVEPPPMALNMREALLQAHFFSHHLRKLYFLLSSWHDPFLDHPRHGSRGEKRLFPPHFLDEIMHHEALAQEAATILGGRSNHPLSAVTGGVSRFLKEDYYHRLSEIAGFCLKFTTRLGEFLRDEIFGDGKALDALGPACGQNLHVEPMASLTIAEKDGHVVLRDPVGKEMDRFSPDMIFEKIGLHNESWTREPFAYMEGTSENATRMGQGGNMFHSEFPIPNPEFFFVGPLARLNSRETLESPLAEEERQRLIGALGPFPHFGVIAAYWALLVELCQAAEKMTELYVQEKLTGPAIRTIPSEMAQDGYAALESPEGLIYHHYETDQGGIVEKVELLGTGTANNALRCFLTQKAVEISQVRGETWKETQNRIEMSLLPF
jgi:F420-non-reducing hydrogenase large subunit